ncbi:iron permease [Clavulina sp. PMI_390]|nr:iron permease [Clavulina sp. PMI_390]
MPGDAVNAVEYAAYDGTGAKKTLQFWLVFVGTAMAVFLSALELTSVGTALPTIVHALNGSDFVWVGSAYALASAACMPPAGGLSNIFGRQPIMLGAIALFATGAAIAGAAKSMNMLVIARSIQGAGGGGILAVSEIIVADLVPLRERGKYEGLLSAVWALASVVGPPIGGALSTRGKWRWLFYLNLPLSGLAAILVYLFLKMRIPKGHWYAKLQRIDWIKDLTIVSPSGNGLIVSSTASVILALTWGGVSHPWTSAKVLVPLIVGFFGIGVFLVYEGYLERRNQQREAASTTDVGILIELTVPLRLMGNRTSLSGFLQTFVHGITSTIIIYYLSTYLQGAQLRSAIRSGVLVFPLACLIAPAAVVVGGSVEVTGKYLPQTYLGWPMCMIGFGLMAILTENSTTAQVEGLQVILAIGLGIIYVVPQFAFLSPISVADNASALALLSWCRLVGQTFGITIGVTILQNSLTHSLPPELQSTFPAGAEISYALIPLIPTLSEPLRSEVRKAFSDAIRQIWYVGIGLSGLGLLCTLPAEALPLSLNTDENWGFNQQATVDGELEAGISPEPLPADEKETPRDPSKQAPEGLPGGPGVENKDVPLHPLGSSL